MMWATHGGTRKEKNSVGASQRGDLRKSAG